MVELREPLDTLITPPARFTAGTLFPRASEIRLYDTTLRDGEQTPGVAFTPEQKYELAGMLSDAGVHIIDMGFPSAAPSERRALQLVLAFFIFTSGSDLHLKYKIGRTLLQNRGDLLAYALVLGRSSD